MWNSRRFGLLSFGGVLGAVVVLPAAAANASGTYQTTATASAGSVSLAGSPVPVPDNTVTATVGSSPQGASLGLGQLDGALGGPLGSSLRTVVPNGANLVTEAATADADGTSSACAGFLAGDCANGQARPITIRLSLTDLPGLASLFRSAASSSSGSRSSSSGSGGPGSALSGLLPTGRNGGSGGSGAKASSAAPPDPLSGLVGSSVVLSLSGPEASCTAGPPGGPGSDFTASQSLASASLDIVDRTGKSMLPGGPVTLGSGDVLGQLGQVSALPDPLSSLLGDLPQLPGSVLGLTIDAGRTSGAGSGPVTKATAGEIALSVQDTTVLDVVGAQAVCGPATLTAAATQPGTAPERPLGGGIQTDEGRSGSGDVALWLGLAGGAALAGGTGGLLWRRRRP